MSVVWNPSTGSTSEPAEAPAAQRTLAIAVVFATVLFNLMLCFVNTTLFGIGSNLVVASEIVLIGVALGITWYRSYTLYAILLTSTAYFFTVMLIRSDFDPKVARDFLIPMVFFFLGNHLGSLRSADRMVTLLIVIALGVAVFEWLALNTYLHYFDVIHYYLARGTEQTLESDSAAGLFIKNSDTGAGLFVNATRFGERTLLPFLGEHRVSGIFMEPVSAGNFGAIAFAWVFLRDRSRVWTFAAKILAIAAILLLADARFGFYVCVFTLVIYLAAPVIRPTMLFVAPFLAIVALFTYAYISANQGWDNSIVGRFLSSGRSIATLDGWQALGLRISDVFTNGYAGDSGYGYVLAKVGLVGLAAVWALFVYAPSSDDNARRFKYFTAFYVVSLLAISASLFSIKTAALLWFLYGTLNIPTRTPWTDTSIARAARNSESAS
jgi:putative polymerase